MLDVIGPRQQALLTLLLENKKGLTIDQIAASLAITRNAVREHVSALERDRLIAPGALVVTRGRPGRLYALTAKGLDLFPKQYGLLARLLLESLTQKLGADNVEAELGALGARLAADLKARITATALPEKARQIAQIMRELGYESEARSSEGAAPAIEAFNCVYHELAQAEPRVCRLDLALLEGLADATVEHRACMARGDASCVFCFKNKA